MQILARLLLLWLALLAPQMAFAQELNVPGRLIAETDRPAPGGTVTLAFLFEPKPGWHGYWENPGDAGLGLQLEWKLPEGVTAGKLRYPVPKPLLIGGLMNHVYEDPHAIVVDVTIDDQIRPGTRLPISVAGNWLACTDSICVPQQGRFNLEMVVGDGTVTSQKRKQFDSWRSAIPVPLDRKAFYSSDGKNYRIAIPYPANAPLDRPYFFTRTTDRIRYAAPQTAFRTGDWLVVETELQGDAGPVDGLLRIGDGQGLLIATTPGSVPKAGEPVAILGADDKRVAAGSVLPSLPLLLLGALVGGLLLNLMPCVFPILGLKALALAKAGGDEQQARSDALAYTLGVIIACLALGATILLLRSAGEEVGWAFQLQEPSVVLGLLILMTAITANLAGLFELPGIGWGDSLTRQAGFAGSFWTGVLAAIVATPCTGPFMAAAMGAAILLPAPEAMMLFAFLGLGIALPFLVIAFIPAVRGRLPKPGPWLHSFRRAMAVPMGLTGLALAWLLWRLAGAYALTIGLVAIALALLAILYFSRVRIGARFSAWALLGSLAAITGFGAWLLPSAQPTMTRSVASFPGALPFDAGELAKLRNAGKPVFVYFTADWCVTCKVNEAAAIHREDTIRHFREKGIHVMIGDFTQRDPAISRFLSDHGRSGVPLYLFYPSGSGPVELPQILTPAIVRETTDI